MKVCTDSCIFGALMASRVQGRVLDIGCGTGLLSLMVAQKSDCQITAIEIDAHSYSEAKLNILHSPWSERIELIHADIRDYAAEQTVRFFDNIICNPPFYTRHLTRADTKKNRAMHGTDLNYYELTLAISRLLHKSGNAYILLPSSQVQEFIQVAQNSGLYVTERFFIYNYIHKAAFREILTLSFHKVSEVDEKHLIIYSGLNTYTSETLSLLKDYYLKL